MDGFFGDLGNFLNPFSGIIGGGMQLLGNYFGNQSAMDRQQQAQQFNAAQTVAQQNFNAQQADLARQFTGQEQAQAMSFNAQEAEMNRTFQEQMSNTAYARAVAGMRAAGLNPILAAGSAASTPSGSAGSIGGVSGAQASAGALGAPGVGATRNLMDNVLSSAAQAQKLSPELDVLSAQADKTKQDTKVGVEQEQVQHRQHQNMLIQGDILQEEKRQKAADADTAEQGVEVAKDQAAKARIERQIVESGPGGVLQGASVVGQQIGGALSGASPLFRFMQSPTRWSTTEPYGNFGSVTRSGMGSGPLGN